MKRYTVTHIAKEQCKLLASDLEDIELKPNEIAGKTVASLVSPGTELNANYLGAKFPSTSGYSLVFEVEEVGDDVKDFKVGQLAFIDGNHTSYVKVDSSAATPLPSGLVPSEAIFARLMGVSMTTLVTTCARPGDLVMVTGAGPVGYLAAEVFRISGYDVFIVEPNDSRRFFAENAGYKTFASAPLDDEKYCKSVALVIECSGHEHAVLDGLKMVRFRGEVVMVGVPWKKQTDLDAHSVLWEVFHNYPVLRSGWEWEIPRESDQFNPYSIKRSRELALKWLVEKKININGVISTHSPDDCQMVYQGHLNKTHKSLCTVFDWTGSADCVS
ncbi:MAG: zinc-binding alcohol dehydrogenase [Kiritimatiellae bacterium]|jgi:threonine dehydrogenase-like Zn-dependent dehydrogenase|nr:zinc-binding alcohol dehydrogenase [Kiritimatiellia bacterium]